MPAAQPPRPAPEPEDGQPRRPLTLTAAAAVQAVQAAGVLGASLLSGADAISGKSYHVSSGIALTVIGVLTAVALGYVAAGLARARHWSRTPALLTQLFTGIVSIYLVQGQRYGWGVPGLALAAAGFATICVPPSMRALTGRRLADRVPPPAPPAATPQQAPAARRK